MRDQSLPLNAEGPISSGLRFLLNAAIIATVVLILMGGLVRVTGSSMGCGGEWPLCDGAFIPALGQATSSVLLEFAHRVAALGAGVLVLACAVVAWRTARWLLRPLGLAVLLMLAQVGLGAMAAQFNLNAWAAVLYQGLALLLLASLLVALLRARLGPDAESRRLGARAQAALRRYRMLAIGSAGLMFVVMLLGALSANQDALWACLELPVCAAVNNVATIQLVHRIATVLVALMLVALAMQTWRVRPEVGLKRAVGTTLVLTILLGLVGIQQLFAARADASTALMVWGSLHLLLSLMIWIGTVTLATLALRAPQVALQTAHLVAKPVPATVTTEASSKDADSEVVLGIPQNYTTWMRIKDYISLTKPRVITLLIFTTIASMYITPAGIPSWTLVFWTFVGGWLMTSGAHSINCYVDRDIDLLMGRTGRRPIPSKRIPAEHALIQGIILTVVAFLMLGFFVNWLTAALALAGMLYYVFIYTLWLKRSSVNNIVIGGGAGAFPPLVGWAAATGNLTLSSLFLFAIIFYWTPPHFWALAIIRSTDYARAGVPMLPVVAGDFETKWQILLYTLMMFMLTLMLTPLQMMGIPYLIMAIALGGIFLYYAVRLRREGTTGAAWGLYRFSLLYLALLFGAMMIDRLWLA
jgi:protoheme IX farnesyltransferase